MLNGKTLVSKALIKAYITHLGVVLDKFGQNDMLWRLE